MKVAELIKHLQKFSPTLEVFHADLNFPGPLEKVSEDEVQLYYNQRGYKRHQILIRSPAQSHIE